MKRYDIQNLKNGYISKKTFKNKDPYILINLGVFYMDDIKKLFLVCEIIFDIKSPPKSTTNLEYTLAETGWTLNVLSKKIENIRSN